MRRKSVAQATKKQDPEREKKSGSARAKKRLRRVAWQDKKVNSRHVLQTYKSTTSRSYVLGKVRQKHNLGSMAAKVVRHYKIQMSQRTDLSQSEHCKNKSFLLAWSEDDNACSKAFYKARKKDMKRRVSKERYRHTKNVAKTAQNLAIEYNVDPDKARLAGLLHDWDKKYRKEDIRARVASLGMSFPDEVLRDMPQVLHGMTAAYALKQEFPSIPSDVLQAVARHTVAALDMSPLDMVVNVADCIEPGRKMPQIKEIRKMVGKVSLEDLFFHTMGVWMCAIIGRNASLYPGSLAVWNYYAKRFRERKKKAMLQK